MSDTTKSESTVVDIGLDGPVHLHLVPDSHVWVQQYGIAKVGDEEWHGRLFFFASKEPAVEQGRSINAMGEQYQFSIDKGLHKRPGADWNFVMVTFASPFGNLTIESPKGVADVTTG